MKFLESLGNSIARCLDAVTERNHRASLINRLRIVIKNERETTARAYVALGKYYYDHLRDRGCAAMWTRAPRACAAPSTR